MTELAMTLPLAICKTCQCVGRILKWEQKDLETGNIISVQTKCLTCWRKQLPWMKQDVEWHFDRE